MMVAKEAILFWSVVSTSSERHTQMMHERLAHLMHVLILRELLHKRSVLLHGRGCFALFNDHG